jgi:glucosamine--fructose-6-phosphate aminotransferase (isomerizing)
LWYIPSHYTISSGEKIPMCGVVGLRCAVDRPELGKLSSNLLRTLEYRGYDSTGAIIQDEAKNIVLRKDVGSPTVVTEKLDIYSLSGKIFCGQVRWATFGTVTKENAQPHEVNCKTHIYGAHNGNITNCDQLKTWLEDQGHKVLSDNDGEMLVHMVEHFFAIELSGLKDINDFEGRTKAMKEAVIKAYKKITGSFAAIIVDPITENMVSIKAGSSLYMGIGSFDKDNNSSKASGTNGTKICEDDFIVSCSDLSAVLSMTKDLLPMKENEFCIFNQKEFSFYNILSGEALQKTSVQSKLNVSETKLNEPYKFFMEQEIHSQPSASQKLINTYTDSKDPIQKLVCDFVDILFTAHKNKNSIYCVACGTSFNAAKTGAIFFNRIANLNISPLLPGDFRSQCSRTIEDGDVIIGVSQSGETKDLIDIFNQLKERGKKVTIITMVNNTNSTLALEKSDLCLPLLCGVEIAVPATKSFINQLLVFYILALNIAEKKYGKEKVKAHWDKLNQVPSLIDKTIKTTQDDIEKVAKDLYLSPSLHILATGMQGVAREGALKVREVVLNHTEGYEGTEFKHGPNTILGVNTIFGLDSIKALSTKFYELIELVLKDLDKGDIDNSSVRKIYKAVCAYAFSNIKPEGLNDAELLIFKKVFTQHNIFESLYSNYPLLFVTGPHSRDVNLTVSQINTHKIRGSNIYIIAEEDKSLYDAVTKVPVMCQKFEYKHGYIKLPKTGSNTLALFSSSVVLQLLALNMSIKKMELLDSLEILDHGVHPDTPKNVSKSITVD